MNEEEQQQLDYQMQQEQEYLSECGACPNCGSGCHISDLGKEADGQICCRFCYESYRDKLLI